MQKRPPAPPPDDALARLAQRAVQDKPPPAGPPPETAVRNASCLRQSIYPPRRQLRPDRGSTRQTIHVAPKDEESTGFNPPTPKDKQLSMQPHRIDPSSSKYKRGAASPDADGLRPGRLSITCIGAENVRRKDQTTTQTKLTPYLRFSVISAASDSYNGLELRKETSVQAPSRENPSFGKEIIEFDFVDPTKSVASDDVKVRVQLRDSTDRGDDLLGEATFSVLGFLSLHRRAGDEWLPLIVPGDDSTNSKLHLEIAFEEGKVGMAVVKLSECTGLSFSQVDGKAQDRCFLSLRLGSGPSQRSRTVRVHDEGSHPCFREEEVLLWIDDARWSEDLTAQVFQASADDEGDNYLAGTARLSLLPYMNDRSETRIDLELQNDEEAVKLGELNMKLQFLEAGRLTVSIRDIRDVGTFTLPTMVVTSKGEASTITKETRVGHDEEVTLPVVDHHEIQIDCRDDDGPPMSDEGAIIIGSVKISLLPVFKSGFVGDTWFQLRHTNEFGATMERGEILCNLKFDGPRGVAYPRYQTQMASFDDRHRTSNGNNPEQQLEPPPPHGLRQGSPRGDAEFTEEEIRRSFKFLDLDRNGYIGAAEIRHVLVCMGELVTDEEIDMMVSMLDENGDGQVSFREFELMMKDPDPSRDDFGRDSGLSPPAAAAAADAEAFDRRKEMETRNLKRTVFSKFVQTNKLRKDDMFELWRAFSSKNQAKAPGLHTTSMLVDYETFCDLTPGVERTGESHKVFDLIDLEHSGKVDVRELVLSLCNFVPTMSVEERCRLMLNLFDEDGSGCLSVDEIEGILVGSHMQSRSAIAKKAQTVMRCADTDGSGGVTLQELRVAAGKFPNLLVPKHDLGH